MSTEAIVVDQKKAPEPGTLFKVKAQEYAANALTIMEIKSSEQYVEVANIFRAGGAFEKEVVAFLAPAKKKTHEAWKEICNTETSITEQIKRGREHLTRLLDAYDRKQQRLAKEKEAVLDQQSVQQEEERLIAQAETLQAEGKHEEALKLLSEPVQVSAPAPIVRPNVPKVAGVVKRIRYKARLKGKTEEEKAKSFIELAKAVGEGRVPWKVFCLDETFCNAQANALRELFSYPGLESYDETTFAGRR